MVNSARDLIIVGNGPSLLDSYLGPKIDQFTHIVRFNGFVLQGFENHVGSRTTIWSRWYALSAMQPMDSLTHIWLNMPIHERTDEKVARGMAMLGESAHKAQVIPSANVASRLQRDLFADLSSEFWPSSGLLAIAHALDAGYEVTIAGIDSWSSEPFHYFEHHDRSQSHHIADIERTYVRALTTSGTVKRLS